MSRFTSPRDVNPGPGESPLPYFGGFYDDGPAQILQTATIPQKITLDNMAYASGVTLSNNGVVHNHNGNYIFSYSVVFTNTSTQIRYADVFVKFNGQTIPGTNLQVAVPSKHGSVNGNVTLSNSSGFIVPMNDGDTVELWWTADDTAVSISSLPASNGVPSSNGVLFTTRQII